MVKVLNTVQADWFACEFGTFLIFGACIHIVGNELLAYGYIVYKAIWQRQENVVDL